MALCATCGKEYDPPPDPWQHTSYCDECLTEAAIWRELKDDE